MNTPAIETSNLLAGGTVVEAGPVVEAQAQANRGKEVLEASEAVSRAQSRLPKPQKGIASKARTARVTRAKVNYDLAIRSTMSEGGQVRFKAACDVVRSSLGLDTKATLPGEALKALRSAEDRLRDETLESLRKGRMIRKGDKVAYVSQWDRVADTKSATTGHARTPKASVQWLQQGAKDKATAVLQILKDLHKEANRDNRLILVDKAARLYRGANGLQQKAIRLGILERIPVSPTLEPMTKAKKALEQAQAKLAKK